MLGAAVALVLVCLGTVQLASDAFFSGAASPWALPRFVPIGFALHVYGFLDRAAPAPYVEATLAQYEMRRGDLRDARVFALRLPNSPIRDEMLGRIAQARGERLLAFQYFFAAPDIGMLRRSVEHIAVRDPTRAYAVEQGFRRRLQGLRTHPDAVADASWMMSVFAKSIAKRSTGAKRTLWLRRALRDADDAAALSPLSEKYLLAVASAELNLGDTRDARRWYRRVLSVNPRNSRALTGLAHLTPGKKR